MEIQLELFLTQINGIIMFEKAAANAEKNLIRINELKLVFQKLEKIEVIDLLNNQEMVILELFLYSCLGNKERTEELLKEFKRNNLEIMNHVNELNKNTIH